MIAVCAVEASGVALASRLVRACPDAVLFAPAHLCPPDLDVQMDLSGLDRMGLSSVSAVGRAVGLVPELVRRLSRAQVVVFVDAPSFHLRVAQYLRGRGPALLQWVSPQIWAWRPGRVRRIARSVDAVLCLFPFEPLLYAHRQVHAAFVGHPAAAGPAPTGLETRRRQLLLVPGSRSSELQRHLPVMLAAAEIWRARTGGRVALAVAPGVTKLALPDWVESVRGVADAARQSRVALVCSGTATLEAALAGVPQVVLYRTDPATYAVGRRWVGVRWLSLPNLLLQRGVIPEHIQRLDPAAIAADVLRLTGTDGVAQAAQVAGLRELLQGEHAIERVVEEIERWR